LFEGVHCTHTSAVKKSLTRFFIGNEFKIF
jgi:hypothetical protein